MSSDGAAAKPDSALRDGAAKPDSALRDGAAAKPESALRSCIRVAADAIQQKDNQLAVTTAVAASVIQQKDNQLVIATAQRDGAINVAEIVLEQKQRSEEQKQRAEEQKQRAEEEKARAEKQKEQALGDAKKIAVSAAAGCKLSRKATYYYRKGEAMPTKPATEIKPVGMQPAGSSSTSSGSKDPKAKRGATDVKKHNFEK
jgi:hypothetical protein